MMQLLFFLVQVQLIMLKELFCRIMQLIQTLIKYRIIYREIVIR